MLRRNRVYAGVTRGKRLVVLVWQRKALAIAIRGAESSEDGRNCGNGSHANNLADRRVNPEWAGSTPVKDEAHVASGNLAPVAGTTDRRIEFRISIDVGGVGVK